MVILDSGHGGMITNDSGELVYATAPAKMYRHADGSIAYEGVINRRVKSELSRLLVNGNIHFRDISEGNIDWPLHTRVNRANDIINENASGFKFLFLSIHCNAGGGSGFEVWTSIGDTYADDYAEICAAMLKTEFSEFSLRTDISDGDADKEADFYVLKKTLCPAVLVELLFFDNKNDWQYMQTDEYYTRVAKALYSFIKNAETI